MRVLFLGTGGYHPNARRHTAGVLLPEIGLLFDAGTGLFRLPEHVANERLTIALSHAHLDHICGLTYLLVPLHTRQIRKLEVLATARTISAVREHLFAGSVFPVMPEATWTAIDARSRIDVAEGAVLTHRPLCSHPGESVAFRLDWTDPATRAHRSLGYVTDTSVDGTYTDFIAGVDLLIHECYFPDDERDWADRTGHSFTSEVTHLARDADVGRLVLTHIDPRRTGDDPIGLELARSRFPRTEVASDLQELVV